MLLGTPLSGHLSDRFGPVPLMLPAAAVVLMLIYGLFSFMVAAPGVGVLVLVVWVMALLKGTHFGPLGG